MTDEKDDIIMNVLIAREAIIDRHGKARGVSGTIKCPVCGEGDLSYSIAHSNGHIWAKCSTKDCVAWME